MAVALAGHLRAEQLGVRELRHVATAFATMAYVDKRLSQEIMRWCPERK